MRILEIGNEDWIMGKRGMKARRSAKYQILTLKVWS